MTTHRLIIFVKNPVAGTVKTRIARTVGDETAVRVYRHLLQYTQAITRHVPYVRTVYYGDFINVDDGWNGYQKAGQTGHDLGERMANAFRAEFEAGGERVVIIGSDCFDITEQHLAQAFRELDQADVVIGPATDGGYYLLGMKRLHGELLTDMPWSQPNLLAKTKAVMATEGLQATYLPTLTDIDEWSDYQKYIQD